MICFSALNRFTFIAALRRAIAILFFYIMFAFHPIYCFLILIVELIINLKLTRQVVWLLYKESRKHNNTMLNCAVILNWNRLSSSEMKSRTHIRKMPPSTRIIVKIYTYTSFASNFFKSQKQFIHRAANISNDGFRFVPDSKYESISIKWFYHLGERLILRVHARPWRDVLHDIEHVCRLTVRPKWIWQDGLAMITTGAPSPYACGSVSVHSVRTSV